VVKIFFVWKYFVSEITKWWKFSFCTNINMKWEKYVLMTYHNSAWLVSHSNNPINIILFLCWKLSQNVEKLLLQVSICFSISGMSFLISGISYLISGVCYLIFVFFYHVTCVIFNFWYVLLNFWYVFLNFWYVLLNFCLFLSCDKTFFQHKKYDNVYGIVWMRYQSCTVMISH
jgi:hypothetical protein